MAEAIQKTMEDPANDYVPVFMPEGSVWVNAPGGLIDPVASVPQCLTAASAGELLPALAALGYDSVSVFLDEPFHGGTTDFNRRVPWLTVVMGGNPAFIVNAGKIANYWNHGVNPFEGSSYENDLRQDFENRSQQAAAGNPDIG